MIPAILGLSRLKLLLGGAVALCAALWAWGEYRERQGVVSERERVEAADRDAAQGVNEDADEAERGVGPDTDPDRLLCDTGGARDNENCPE
ncbi:MAG: hypothetical protein AAF943_15745 [Pseudomonadota bacterium]